MNAQLALPLARNTDPTTSHLAAVSVKPANQELVTYIRRAIEQRGPLTHEEIVVAVEEAQPSRWLSQTIVTACARACLHEWDVTLNSRRRPVVIWALTPPTVQTIVVGDVL